MHIKVVNVVNVGQRMYYRLLILRVKLYFEQMSYTNINKNVSSCRYIYTYQAKSAHFHYFRVK